MTSIGLGKITVATAGTPIPLSTITSQKKVHRILVTYDPADGASSYIYVKDSNGNLYAAVSATSGVVIIGGDEGNQLDTTKYQFDASGNSKGAIIGIDIE
jgi:hypothetical protein